MAMTVRGSATVGARPDDATVTIERFSEPGLAVALKLDSRYRP